MSELARIALWLDKPAFDLSEQALQFGRDVQWMYSQLVPTAAPSPSEPPSEGFSRAVTGLHEPTLPDWVTRQLAALPEHQRGSAAHWYLIEENERLSARIQQLEAERDLLVAARREGESHIAVQDRAIQAMQPIVEAGLLWNEIVRPFHADMASHDWNLFDAIEKYRVRLSAEPDTTP